MLDTLPAAAAPAGQPSSFGDHKEDGGLQEHDGEDIADAIEVDADAAVAQLRQGRVHSS
jgi:hypothetical protein